MDALLLLATAAEGAEETSQTPFYVIGLVLAAFAVIVAGLGIARASFSRAATAVMALGALLTVATMATVLVTA